jgi:hypothetical protein
LDLSVQIRDGSDHGKGRGAPGVAIIRRSSVGREHAGFLKYKKILEIKLGLLRASD